MTVYLKDIVKDKDHYLLFPNSLPSELIVFSPGKNNIIPQYSNHSERQMKRLQRLRTSAQSTALVPKTMETNLASPPIKAPPSLKELREMARSPANKRVSNQPKQHISYASAVDSAATPLAIVPASPNHSISTITESQPSQGENNKLAFPNPPQIQSNAMTLFRQETEKELARQAQETVDTLQLFRSELVRANKNNAEFRDTLLEAQKVTTSSMTSLQVEQKNTNQRLQNLESNMAITVKGIEALLQKSQNSNPVPESTSNPSGTLQQQGQDP